MKRNLIIYLILFANLFICSCTEKNSKDKYLSNFEEFITEIETDTVFTAERRSEITSLYDHYTIELYNIHSSDLTETDRQMIGKYKARYYKATSIKEFKNAINTFNDIKDEATGFIKEIMETTNE